jgi:iron complex outermembrane receptor protein
LPAGPQTLAPTSGNTYDYTQGQASPSASIIYKPLPKLSLYGSYIQGLAAGGTAPDTFSFNNVTKAVTNAGDQLGPSVNNQYEVGAKGTFGDLYLTAALFRIEKVNEETDPSDFVYKKSGQEVHQGLELTATGKLTDDLTVVGGLTWLQARIDQSKAIPADDGKIPFGVPEQEARLYLEYAIPGIQNLILSFGANYFGRRPVDTLNTGFIPDVTTFDAGLRYEPELWGRRTSFDLTVSNLFDKNYWGSVSDYGEGLLLGSPRIISFSARVSF